MATPVRFWLDPICPWCWVTAQWVRSVEAARDLEVTWEPISLFRKNAPTADSPSFERLVWSNGLLRVLESVRVAEGERAVGDLYLEFGRRIHHDGQRGWDVVESIDAVGLDRAHAGAADESSWETELARRMDEGLALVGADVGTPIVSVLDGSGRETALFGPVITKVPSHDSSLALWDALVQLSMLDEFFELKRTRNRSPEFGPRP